MFSSKQYKRNSTNYGRSTCECVNKYNECGDDKYIGIECNCQLEEAHKNNCKNNRTNNCDCQNNNSNLIDSNEIIFNFYDRNRTAIVDIATEYIRGSVHNYGTGSGFLIAYNNNIYVITSAHVVLNSTVDDPMTLIYCGISFPNPAMVDESLNRFSYRAKIVGVDATADVAVLRLINQGQLQFPRVGKHPTIEFGNEFEVHVGEPIFNISNPLFKDHHSFTSGHMRDNKWADVTGKHICSSITTDLLVYSGSSGSPVLDSKTGLCLGIVSFGFTDNNNINNIGFGGGTGSSTLLIILDHIFNNKSVALVMANNGERYLTNLKGYFGKVTWVNAVTTTITALYPNNFQNLQSQGIILTKTDINSPLAHPIDNSRPLTIGDIIISLTHNDVKTVFGSGTNQFAVGFPLWRINPSDNRNNIVTLEVIRNPKTNSRIETIKVRLNINYNPSTEKPPNTNTLLGFATQDLINQVANQTNLINANIANQSKTEIQPNTLPEISKNIQDLANQAANLQNRINQIFINDAMLITAN